MPSSTTTVTLVNSSSNSNGKSALCATASNASTIMLVSDSKEDSRELGDHNIYDLKISDF